MARPIFRALLLAAVAAAAAACADTPAGLPAGAPVIAPPPVQAALRCRIDVRAETLACRPADAGTAPGISPLIIGGQGTNVRLASTGTSYDAGTGIFRSEVTVENLMAHALGTDDGVFPSPQGLRVFFHTGPTASAGSGQVTVANADGEAVFTAGAQPYFQYAGLLAPGDTSAAREWRFDVPGTVELFEFTVFVAAAVPGEAPPSAALFILSGAGLTDTVDAEPDSILRIGVRGRDGKPAADVRVEMATVQLPGSPFLREVMVAPAGGSYFYQTSASTDSMGIAEFQAKMGTRAGPGRLVVYVQELEVQDTVRYTIVAGNVGQVRSLPEDTAVFLGGRAPLRLAAYDRHGNPRSDAVALSLAGGPARVEGSDVVADSSIGMVTAVAAAAGYSDTSLVRVVPRGTVGAPVYGDFPDEVAGIYTFSLDGSDLRRVHTTLGGPGHAPDLSAAWIGPTRMAYHDEIFTFNIGFRTHLYTLDLATGTSARLLPEADRMEHESVPRASRDGSWIYFAGGTSSKFHVHRVRPDGSGLERISEEGEFVPSQWSADPSPDGTRLAFVQGDTHNGHVYLMDLATRKVSDPGVPGLSPRWSPDGTRIAYAGDPLLNGWRRPGIMNADGTGARTLSQTPIWGDINWSPDGRYLVASSPIINDVVIFDVQTGAEVVLRIRGLAENLVSPVWRP